MKKVSIEYNKSGDMMEVFIKEMSGRKIETFKFSLDNSNTYGKMIEYIYEKYGVRPTISNQESINFTNKNKTVFDM